MTIGNLPKGWRIGQFMFNFFQWLKTEKSYPAVESYRMADPFHISDDEFEKLLEEYLKNNEEKTN